MVATQTQKKQFKNYLHGKKHFLSASVSAKIWTTIYDVVSVSE